MLKKFAVYSLLSLFLAFYASITLFSHNHIINGVTIVHSHFYGTSGDKPVDHHHTAKGFSLIQLLTHFSTTIVAGLFGLSIFFSLLYKLIVNPGENYIIQSWKYTCSLRAPPSF